MLERQIEQYSIYVLALVHQVLEEVRSHDFEQLIGNNHLVKRIKAKLREIGELASQVDSLQSEASVKTIDDGLLASLHEISSDKFIRTEHAGLPQERWEWVKSQFPEFEKQLKLQITTR